MSLLKVCFYVRICYSLVVINHCSSKHLSFAPTGSADPEPKPTDARPLAGLPIAIKDTFSTSDMPTTACSDILQGVFSSLSFRVVLRYHEADLCSFALLRFLPSACP
jgi:Asp-tRNA(Asn)/Glu-tRNA(Gln) amidotransferase A subunit family amidase